ncbi:MAG: hypothetical protein J5613_02425, partial [Alphaproteobacteria bacterium]|nr:hypothetical protein [Alphaproteobacteria bacterium]
NGLIDALRNLPRGSVVLFSNSADAMSTIDKLKRLWDTANNAKDTFKFFNAAGQAVDRLSN